MTNKGKRILAVLMAFIVLLSSAFVMCSNVAGMKLGDVNEDGKINSVDANLFKRFLSGTIEIENVIELVDINGDDAVNAIDANLLIRIIAGSYTPETPDIPETIEPTLKVETVETSAGEQNVEVKIHVENNPGILAMMLTLEYDTSVLTLTGTANGEVTKSLSFTKPGKLTSPCNFIWDGVEISESDVKDGTILTLTFDIADNAKAGEYDIKISYPEGSIIDNNIEIIEFEVVNGSVTVK